MRSPADMSIIQIEITNRCWKRCSNCTRMIGHYPKDRMFFMDMETFKAAVDSMEGFEEIVGIMGGEPLLHPQFAEMMEYYCSKIPKRRRGLWTSLHDHYFRHFDLIQETFDRARQFLNDHNTPSIHQPILVASQDVVPDREERDALIDDCWVQNLWSASITPKGAFFCEIAAAFDMLLDGPGGWPIEPGWWKRQPTHHEFIEQRDRWCHGCGAAIPLERRETSDIIDDMSPYNVKRLMPISPKVKKGDWLIYNRGMPEDWAPNAEWYIRDPGHRMSEDNRQRMADPDSRAIDGVVVCVNYSDYLALTLPANMKYLRSCLVVTDLEDKKTVEVASSIPGVSVLRTDAFYINGSPFCKSAALKVAFEHLQPDSWVLLWDADILFRDCLSHTPLGNLDQSKMYAPEGKFHALYQEMGSNRHHDGTAAAGFFQLFHGKHMSENPVTSPDASVDDVLFSQQFSGVKYLPMAAVHLGPRAGDGEPNINWQGRRSEPSQWTAEQVEELTKCDHT